MRFFSLFGGIGGFDLAAASLGWRRVGYCERDKYALQTFRANFPVDGEFFWDDATTMPVEKLPDFEVLFAGFPCPPYSRAGKRRGMEDPRGQLFHEITRTLGAKRPPSFLLENVAGLTDKPFSRVFWSMRTALVGLGYRVFTRVLNSADFGVPQHRERVFFAGFRDGGGLGEEFAWPAAVPLRMKLRDVLERDVPPKYYVSERLMESLRRHRERHAAKGHGFGYTLLNYDAEYAEAVQARYFKGGPDNLLAVAKGEAEVYSVPHGNNAGGLKESPMSPTLDNAGSRFLVGEPSILHQNKSGTVTEHDEAQALRSGGSHSYQPVREPRTALIQSRGMEVRKQGDSHALKGADGGSSKIFVVETANRNSMRSDSWFKLAEVSNVLDTTGAQGVAMPEVSNAVTDGYLMDTSHHALPMNRYRVRRLTPRECARLQGFPESFKVPVSDAQAYRQFGNAVTVPVIEAILRKMEPWLQVSDIP